MLNPYSSTLPDRKYAKSACGCGRLYGANQAIREAYWGGEISSVDWIMDFDSNDFQSFVSSTFDKDFLSTPVPDEIIEQIIADGSFSELEQHPTHSSGRGQRGCPRPTFERVLSRWEAIKGARSGLFGKIKAVLKRKGLPTSNWIVTRPYHKDLIERSKNQGKEFFSFIGIDRDDKEAEINLGPEIMSSLSTGRAVYFHTQIIA